MRVFIFGTLLIVGLFYPKSSQANGLWQWVNLIDFEVPDEYIDASCLVGDLKLRQQLHISPREIAFISDLYNRDVKLKQQLTNVWFQSDDPQTMSLILILDHDMQPLRVVLGKERFQRLLQWHWRRALFFSYRDRHNQERRACVYWIFEKENLRQRLSITSRQLDAYLEIKRKIGQLDQSALEKGEHTSDFDRQIFDILTDKQRFQIAVFTGQPILKSRDEDCKRYAFGQSLIQDIVVGKKFAKEMKIARPRGLIIPRGGIDFPPAQNFPRN